MCAGLRNQLTFLPSCSPALLKCRNLYSPFFLLLKVFSKIFWLKIKWELCLQSCFWHQFLGKERCSSAGFYLHVCHCNNRSGIANSTESSEVYLEWNRDVRVGSGLEKMWAVVMISWIIVYVKGKKIYTYILDFFSLKIRSMIDFIKSQVSWVDFWNCLYGDTLQCLLH